MTLLAQQKDNADGDQPKSYSQLPPPSSNGDGAPQPVRAPQPAEGSVGALVAQLSEQVSTLVRDELQLAELEAKQRGKKLGAAFGALGAAGGMAFFGACCFATAAILALAMIMRPWAAALLVGAGFMIVSGMLGLPGLIGMRFGSRGIGKESVESVKADVAAVRGAVRK
ncbi:MAG TPA: phage holin family protein [Jatrophihabitantaceae bacterium]|jgi:membrane protein|nr:phage holin family protein [Jatrophihabitantaceae bacterium]